MKPHLTLSELSMEFIRWVDHDYGAAGEGSISKNTLLHMGAAFQAGVQSNIDECVLLREQVAQLQTRLAACEGLQPGS